MNLVIVGATGMVGRNFLKVLEERKVKVDNLYLFASANSKGKEIEFNNKKYIVKELKYDSFKGIDVDYALFSAGGAISKEYAPLAVKEDIVVIDNSSAWRMDKDVPLVVPEVNKEEIKNHKGIISNPNCSTIQAVVAVNPLKDKYGIKRIVYSTYQSVSGAGMSGYKDLENGIKNQPNKKFDYPIFSNCIPHIDVPMANGYTKEEMKLVDETQKILNDYTIKITATAVRVPVFNCHCESVNIELNNSYELKEVEELLINSENIIVMNDIDNKKYPMPIDVDGKDEVFVGRIRRDYSIDNGLNMWVVADNARKGAATNAIQILEELIKLGN